MSKKHDRVLAAILDDHPSANLHWQEIESLLVHLGAQLHESRGARVIASLRGQEMTLHRPHHGASVGRTELHQLRQFLRAAGVTD
jgi:hypothetical protein